VKGFQEHFSPKDESDWKIVVCKYLALHLNTFFGLNKSTHTYGH